MTNNSIKINKISWNKLGQTWKGIAESYPFGVPPDVAIRLFRQAEKHIIGTNGPSRGMEETFERRSDITGLALDVGISPDTIAKATLRLWGRDWRDKLCAEPPDGFKRLEPMNEPKRPKN